LNLDAATGSSTEPVIAAIYNMELENYTNYQK